MYVINIFYTWLKPLKEFFLQKYIMEFGGNIFSKDAIFIFCELCEVKVGTVNRFIDSAEKHILALNGWRYKN